MSATNSDIASRLRCLRLIYQLSLQELAERSGVHRTVVAKAERSGSIRESTLRKIGNALGVAVGWLRQPYLGSKGYRLDCAHSATWLASRPSYIRRKGIQEIEDLANPAERLRMGTYELANAFIRPLNIDLPGARIRSVVVESYRRDQDPVTEEGQIFLYILEGKLKIQIGEETLLMEKDDAISYWGDQPNLYEVIPTPECPMVKVLEVFVPLRPEEIALRDEFA